LGFEQSSLTLKVAVVGAGPGGFYAAGALLRSHPRTEVTLIERSPVPYGLVRYGVAPDHPSLKAVSSLFERTGRDPRVTFFGNTRLWRDVSLPELLSMHHAVILAIGAPRDRLLGGAGDGDRLLGGAGDGVEGLYRASQMVGWYNSDPDHSHFTPQFGAGRVCIFGHGNVAADITRVLLAPPERLSCTDISEKALIALRRKPIREIHLVGRRGPSQTRFTPPLIAELLALPEVDVVIDAPDESMADGSAEEPPSPAAKEVRRILRDAAQKPRAGFERLLRLVFRSTAQMIRSERGLVHVALAQKGRSGLEVQSLRFDAAISATGFELTGEYCHSLPLTAGALSNRSGQVIDAQDRLVPGLYTVGWAARGATGTIGTCRSDAERLVNTLLTHSTAERTVGGRAALTAALRDRHHRVTTFDEWLQLDRLERESGAAAGRSRLKMPTVVQQLEAMNSFALPDRMDPCVINTHDYET
jgi:ferredoxin--NADP+ reductase